jgi:hypothetical protein
MAKIYTGRDGSMWLNPDVAGATTDYGRLAKVTNYSFQADLELLETTSLGDNLKTFVPGIQSFSGNATLLYYKNDDGRTSANRLLRRLIKSGSDGVSETSVAETSGKVILLLRLQDGDINTDIKFNAWITSATIGASVGEVVSAQISFTATGALDVQNMSI